MRRFVYYLLSILLSCFSGSTSSGPRTAIRTVRLPREDSIENGSRTSLSLAELLPGRIIFNSDKLGRSAIYSMNTDGSDVRCLCSSELHDLYPSVSPCSKYIVFARAEGPDRNAKSDIYVADSLGQSTRCLVENGTFPSFDITGEHVIFERNRKSVMRFSVTTNSVEELFPGEIKGFEQFEIAKPRLSNDGRYLYFISDRQGRWNVWGVELDTKKPFWVGAGCEPTASPDGKQVFWVRKQSFFGRTGIATRNIDSGENHWLADTGPENGFKYYPTLVRDGSVLLFCSGDGSEYTHRGAKYQMFAKDLSSGSCFQLSHEGVNRWPSYLPAA